MPDRAVASSGACSLSWERSLLRAQARPERRQAGQNCQEPLSLGAVLNQGELVGNIPAPWLSS